MFCGIAAAVGNRYTCPGGAASRGRSARHLVNLSGLDPEPARRGNPFCRSKADEQSTPPGRAPAARPRPKIWALMGLRDGPLKRLLDSRLQNLEVAGLENWGSWSEEQLRRAGAAGFLFPVDKHLSECLKSGDVQHQRRSASVQQEKLSRKKLLAGGVSP